MAFLLSPFTESMRMNEFIIGKNFCWAQSGFLCVILSLNVKVRFTKRTHNVTILKTHSCTQQYSLFIVSIRVPNFLSHTCLET